MDHDVEVQLEAFTISERESWRQTSHRNDACCHQLQRRKQRQLEHCMTCRPPHDAAEGAGRRNAHGVRLAG